MDGRVRGPLSGGLYAGDAHRGRAQGQAHVEWLQRPRSAVQYDGAMLQGIRHGHGRWVVQPETVYEGAFAQHLRHGYGAENILNHATWAGEFREGQLKGTGEERHMSGRQGQGTYDSGVLNGDGRLQNADGSVFEGHFIDGRRHGRGRTEWKDGEVYVGDYDNDLRHGNGTYTWPDGRVYEGEFCRGTRHGQGVFRWPSGTHFVGQFDNDQRLGLGTLFHADGTVDHGLWQGTFLVQFLPPALVAVPVKTKDRYAKKENARAKRQNSKSAHHRSKSPLSKLALAVEDTRPISAPLMAQPSQGTHTLSARAFLEAAKTGDLATVEELFFTQRVHIDVRDPQDINALLLAAVNGHIEVLRFLLHQGAYIDHCCARGVSALIAAYRMANKLPLPSDLSFPQTGITDPAVLWQICQELLQRGAQADEARLMEPVLKTAISIADETMVRLLLRLGANPDIQFAGDATQRSPLIQAAIALSQCEEHDGERRQRFEAIVTMLTQHGAHLDCADFEGNTALHYMVAAARPRAMLEVLLAAGANPNILNKARFTALAEAVRHGSEESLAALLDHKADPNIPVGLRNDQALHLAAIGSEQSGVSLSVRVALVKKLLEAGADPTLMVPVAGVKDPQAIGTLMDSAHYCFFKAQHVIGRLGAQGNRTTDTATSLHDARHSVQLEQAIASAVLARMRLAVFSQQPLAQAFCIECGRSYRQHLLPLSGSQSISFCSDRCKMKALNGSHRKALMAALNHTDPDRWKYAEVADDTKLVWQPTAPLKPLHRSSTCPPDFVASASVKARSTAWQQKAAEETAVLEAMEATSTVEAVRPKPQWQLQRGSERPSSAIYPSANPSAAGEGRKALLEPLRLPRTVEATKTVNQPTPEEDGSKEPIVVPAAGKRNSRQAPIMDLSRLRWALQEEVRARLDRAPALALVSTIRPASSTTRSASSGRHRRGAIGCG